MVLLTVTDAAQKAIEAFRGFDAATLANDIPLEDSGVGSPIEHWKLVEISKTLVQQSINAEDADVSKHWRLDALLKGSTIYRPPPPPKKEQVHTPCSEMKEICKTNQTSRHPNIKL